MQELATKLKESEGAFSELENKHHSVCDQLRQAQGVIASKEDTIDFLKLRLEGLEKERDHFKKSESDK